MDTAWPATLSGFRIAYHPRVGSTQDEARRRMETGAREFVVVAGEQTGGHGRLGRSWASPPGNLYASVVTVLRFPREFLPAGSLIAANALCTALAGLAPASPPPLAVKWPNDVLLDGRKVAGLLLEVSGDVVVVGCGVNLKAVPSDLVQATTLAVHGFDADAPRVLERWLDAWNVAVSALAEGDTGGWRDAWLARAAGLHRPIRVTLADRRLEGIHRGIDAHGALRVETAGGLETVLAGDVELVRLGETF